MRCGHLVAIHIEIRKAFGVYPVFRYNSFDLEIVLDVPFMRIIGSGPKTLQAETARANDKNEGAYHGTRDQKRVKTAQGTSETRP